MKRFYTILFALLFVSISNLKAEEFIATRGTYEQNGKSIELSDLSNFPSFYADYYPNEDAVKIKCSAGNLVLKRGTFFYAYRGVYKGLIVTATAHVENGSIKSIVYEELDKAKDIKAILSYSKK